MAIKAIFAECSESFWVDVAVSLKRESDWQPCYWIAMPDLESIVKRAFPEIVFHYTIDAIRGHSPHDCSGLNLATLDQALLQDLAVYESTIFNMLDRMDPGCAFSYQEREGLYHLQIKYWLSVLQHYQPDVVVFPASPHIVYDYILYILCKRQGIRTVTFLTLTIEGLFYPIERFEDRIEPVISLYKELLSRRQPLELTLSPIAENYWKKVLGSYDIAFPSYIKHEFLQKAKENNLITIIMKKLRTLCKYIQFIYKPAPHNYIKLKGRKFDDSKMTYLKYIWLCKFKAEQYKRKLKSCYNKLAEPVCIDKPYIYVVLHYQPEKTTSPDGGVFVNQLLMIDLLSKLLPKGWSLYVKEHIVQFSPYAVGERSRPLYFYDDIASLPNVKLVSLSVSSFDLIDNSKAVATVTGTVGWEAVIRGKPVLIFGYAWYRGCEGVFYTPTQSSCKEALSKIEKGYKVNTQNVRAFIYALEKFSFQGYVDSSYKKLVNISPKENVISVTRAIQSLWENGQYKGENIYGERIR